MSNKPRFASLDALHKEIDRIKTAAAKMDDRIQQAGLGCLEHVEAHGDIGPANRLYAALGAGHRRTALGQWFIAHGKLVANKDAKAVKEGRVMAYDKAKVTDITAAIENPWHNFAPEKALDEFFDLQKAMGALLAKASGKKMSTATLEKLKAAAAATGVKFEPKKAPVLTDVVTTDGGDAPM